MKVKEEKRKRARVKEEKRQRVQVKAIVHFVSFEFDSIDSLSDRASLWVKIAVKGGRHFLRNGKAFFNLEVKVQDTAHYR